MNTPMTARRCRYGFGQHWACYQRATVEVVYTYGVREYLCAYHAERAAKVAELVAMETKAAVR